MNLVEYVMGSIGRRSKSQRQFGQDTDWSKKDHARRSRKNLSLRLRFLVAGGVVTVKEVVSVSAEVTVLVVMVGVDLVFDHCLLWAVIAIE